MLTLKNNTDHCAAIFSGNPIGGERQYTLVVKIGYAFNLLGQLTRLPKVVIQTLDQWEGEIGNSCLLQISDIAPFKQGGEILLQGKAYPEQPDQHLRDVQLSLQQGDILWRKSLRVFGARYWQRTLMEITKSAPAILKPTPLTYESAYGGVSVSDQSVYEANPIGMGFMTRERDCASTPLPLVELPPPFIEKPSQRVKPASFAPLPFEWQPRKSLLEKIKLDPVAYPLNFYNAAPEDQQLSQPFLGREILSMTGFFQETNNITLTIPEHHFQLLLLSQTQTKPIALHADTLSINTELKEIYILWRASIAESSLKFNGDSYELLFTEEVI